MKRLFLALFATLLVAGCAQNLLFNSVLTHLDWFAEFPTGDGSNPDNNIVFVIDDSASMGDEMALLVSAITNPQNGLLKQLADEDFLKYQLIATTFYGAYVNLVGNKLKLKRRSAIQAASDDDTSQILTFFEGLQTRGEIQESGIGTAGMILDDGNINFGSADSETNTHIIVLSDEDNQEIATYSSQYENLPLHLVTTGASRYRFEWDFTTRDNKLKKSQCKDDSAPNSGAYQYCEEANGYGVYVTYPFQPLMCNAFDKYDCTRSADNGLETVTISLDLMDSQWRDYEHGCVPSANAVPIRSAVSRSPDISVYPWVYELPPIIDASSCAPVTCRGTTQASLPASPQITTDNQGTVTYIEPTSCPAGFSFYRPGAATMLTSDQAINFNVQIPDGYFYETGARYYQQWANHTFDYPATQAQARDWYVQQYGSAPADLVIRQTSSTSGQDVDIVADGDGFQQFLQEFHPEKTVTFNSIVARQDGFCPGGGTENNTLGQKYLDLTDALGGIKGDICNPDFTEFMQKLADQIKLYNRPEFQLPQWADPAAILIVTDVQTGATYIEDAHFTFGPRRLKIFFKTGVLEPNHTLRIEHRSPTSLREQQEGEDQSEDN